VFELYEASRRGLALKLEPSRPYADYIGWLNKQDQAGVETYWRKALQGFSTPTPIGNASAVSAGRGSRHGDETVHLDLAMSDRLKRFARRRHLTLNTLVQAAWALLLSFYTGEADIVFGATVSGRPPELTGVEKMIGLFINTLPVRVSICPEDLTAHLLERTQSEQAEARQYGTASLASIQMWSEVARGQPLFETLVIFENYPAAEIEITSQTGLSVEEGRGYEQTHYPLCLLAWSAEDIGLRFSYDRLRFEDETIRRLAKHYQNILTAFAADDAGRVSSISLLGNEEREQLLAQWNRTEVEIPAVLAHTSFEKQADTTPHAVALTFENRHLTYEALNQHANQLAHHLRKNGVGPEVRVALHLERSLDLVVSVLAILKAGGAYVPLDPRYPVERLRYMLQDCGAAVLLTQESLSGPLDPGQARVVVIDKDCDRISHESQQNIDAVVSVDNLAYVLYTSGSTGQPKGVQVEHRALANLLGSIQREIQLTRNDLLVAVTTLSFDIATMELLLPLTVGARVRIASREESLDGHLMGSAIIESGATVLQATPATHRILLESEFLQRGLRVLCGGEEMSAELARLLSEQSPETWNLYGPTETTIWATMHRVAMEKGERIPIGKPLANMKAYVLGRTGALLPSEVAGELFLGGTQLARGYLGQPGLTAERFIPDAFGLQPGGRLYRTGDLVKWRNDGELEFLSRIDRQVKIRGFRIELSEIEASLGRHTAVQHSLVIARRDRRDAPQLIAYVVGKTGAEPPPSSELRDFLRRSLPEHMVPLTYVVLQSIPLSPNGKVDYRQLPDPESELQEQRTYVAPRDETEEVLCRIWQEVFQLERIGVDDDFFELGGHSLPAMQIASRIRRKFEIAIPLVELFRAPTISKLRVRIEEYRAAKAPLASVSNEPENMVSDTRDQVMSEVLRGLESLSDEEAQALLGLSTD
jgi:amino acid adenylation domain-containing protein